MFLIVERAMKLINLLLVLNIVFCYTGLSASVCHSNVTTSNTASTGCHSASKDKSDDSNISNESFHETPETINQTASMCHYALSNNPQIHDFNLKHILSHSFVVNIPNLEINRVFASHLTLETKKEYRPPDLFLLNSTFLI